MSVVVSSSFDGVRTIPSPQCTQAILNALQLHPSDKVLEIGTGSGTQTKAFAESGAEVHSIELEPFVELTKDLGGQTYLHHGDGALGIEPEAPFTAIVATCGVEKIPDAWTKQLAEGGKLIAPIGDARSQKLTQFSKTKGDLIPVRILAYVRFLMMKHVPKPEPMKPQYKDGR